MVPSTDSSLASPARYPVEKGTPPATGPGLSIRLCVDGQRVTATLLDNATARDFASLLPLNLTLTDYASTEKISDLPRPLSAAGAPRGTDASAGDISYYAPWGNLALFYRDSGYATGLVRLAPSRRESGCCAREVRSA